METETENDFDFTSLSKDIKQKGIRVNILPDDTRYEMVSRALSTVHGKYLAGKTEWGNAVYVLAVLLERGQIKLPDPHK